LTAEQVNAAAAADGAAAFSDVQRAVVSYARELTRTARVSPETVKALKKHLGDQELVELAFTVATANFSNRIIHGLGIELE
jgi:alkylhydroperoxidase family enzyme